jgi:hypothetical protein
MTKTTTPRYYCTDCPTPAGDCQCNWSERAIAAHEASLEALAQQSPVQPHEFQQWIDKFLGQSYGYLKSFRKDDFDKECITHLSDVIHSLGELKECYSEVIPF